MGIGRLLVFEDGKISMSSKKCFSCENFTGSREIVDVEKFCSGVVVRVKCNDEADCERKEKKISYEARCPDWKLWKELKKVIEKILG